MLPKDAKKRKEFPIYRGLFKFFPDALAAVAHRSYQGSAQHHGEEGGVWWDRSKSGDELDAMLRHVLEEDWDAVAWRALAHLQKQIENENKHTHEYIIRHDGIGEYLWCAECGQVTTHEELTDEGV